ncbi:hypothetical protein VUR80DRAFT_71 [Thermomyces stellatus]
MEISRGSVLFALPCGLDPSTRLKSKSRNPTNERIDEVQDNLSRTLSYGCPCLQGLFTPSRRSCFLSPSLSAAAGNRHDRPLGAKLGRALGELVSRIAGKVIASPSTTTHAKTCSETMHPCAVASPLLLVPYVVQPARSVKIVWGLGTSSLPQVLLPLPP